MRVQVVCGQTPEQLAERVQERLSSGWRIQGEPFKYYDSNDGQLFYQEIVTDQMEADIKDADRLNWIERIQPTLSMAFGQMPHVCFADPASDDGNHTYAKTFREAIDLAMEKKP